MSLKGSLETVGLPDVRMNWTDPVEWALKRSKGGETCVIEP